MTFDGKGFARILLRCILPGLILGCAAAAYFAVTGDPAVRSREVALGIWLGAGLVLDVAWLTMLGWRIEQ